MNNIVKFYPKDAANNPDVVLERSAGRFQSVMVIGRDFEGKLDVRASMNLDYGDILYLMEQFKHKLMSGDYSE